MPAPDAADEKRTDLDLSPAGRARAALGLELRRLIRNARTLISTECDPVMAPADYITEVRELIRAQGLVVLACAVAAAATRGAGWPAIAAALGLPEDTARARYEEWVARLAAGEPADHGPTLPDGTHPAGLPPAPAPTWDDAAELEAWYLRTADPDDPVERQVRPGRPRGEHPVTGNLR